MELPLLAEGSDVVIKLESCELAKEISVAPKKYEKLYLQGINFIK
jgi:hypothetical protein